MKKKETVSQFSMICMCIGSIIGGGVFGSLCVAIGYAGTGIVWGFILAIITVIAYTLPSLIPSTTIPAANGLYTVLCRLVSPYVGVLEFVNLITLLILNISLATTFSVYFCEIFPVNQMAVTIGALLLVADIAYLGFQFGAMVQNIMTAILIVTLMLFVILGAGHIDPANVSLESIIMPELNGGIASLFAASGILVNTIQGGNTAVVFAEKVENPRKVILNVFFWSTGITSLLFIAMSVVSVGINPAAEDLSDVARSFMSTPMFYAFIIGGALLAIFTTINAQTLAGAVRFESLARDKLLPNCFAKKNKFGQAPLGLIVITAAGILIAFLNLSLGTLFSLCSALSLVMAIVNLLPVLLLDRQYPHSYAHSPFKMPRWLIYLFIVFSAVFSIYQIYALIIAEPGSTWIATAIAIVAFYVYFLLRKSYLAKKGVDLIAEMRRPIPEWVEREQYFADLDAKEQRQ